MLYIFHVDTGTMLTFDMGLAIESVNQLKLHIEKSCNIPTDKQVLLVSGGESLDASARVCSYSAGTDTNPIYLFSKACIESVTPPPPSIEDCSTIDFIERVKESHDMPATYNTVCKRAHMAQLFYDSAKQHIQTCFNLVHEQHLQQQGWAAVIANFEDGLGDFIRRSETFEKNFSDYVDDRDKYLTCLENFNNDLQTLLKIPMLPILLDCEKECEEPDNNRIDDTNSAKCRTLLDWIVASDTKSSMEVLFEHCSKGVEQFDAKTFNSLKAFVEKFRNDANDDSMKDIKGISDRLCGLEQLMFEAKRYVQEQSDLTQSFVQNQNRASNIGDASILPDLCESHSKQLVVMLHNHQQLSDIRRRCVHAKMELCRSLHRRLRWIMYIENMMFDIDHKMVVHNENLKRLKRHLAVIQQIHMAPATYLSAVAEVIRRRAFSQAFLSWASELACYLLAIHNDEITRRKEFHSQFEGHFLNSLFPGMEDLPPSFATEAPLKFDSSLPKLTVEDIEFLKREVPELADNISVPDITAINNLFLVKSFIKTDLGKVDDRGVEEKIVEVVNEVGLASNLDQNLLKPADSETCLLSAHGIPHLKDLDKGCESETDTEEFEKVGQSPLELNFEKISPRPHMQDVSTLTEDNLHSSRSEQDRLRALLSKMAVLSQETIRQLKLELNEIKEYFILERACMETQYESLSSSWENLTVSMDNKEREVLQRVTLDYELELKDYKRLSENRLLEIQTIQNEILHLQKKLESSSEETLNLRQLLQRLHEEHKHEQQSHETYLNQLRMEHQQNVKDTSEKLHQEHKAEIENIRARFRLVPMERSPSETNLDKIYRSDTNHETIVLQLKENYELEKQKAISTAVLQESRKWESILNEKLSALSCKYELEKEIQMHEINQRISEEKDKQIDILREREANLNLECIKYKNTIQQLAESERESNNVVLLDRLEALENEKKDLELMLNLVRSRKIDDSMNEMGTSVAVCEGRVSVATSPIKQEKLSKSQIRLVKSGRLSIDSCHSGDAVLVIWDAVYKNYRILQEGGHLYFLHSDCLETLGLSNKSNEEHKPYFTAEVVEKDYCHAKKVGNRYSVPKGTKFFRVIVKPLSHPREEKEAVSLKSQMTQSETTGPTIPEVPPHDAAVSWSVPVTPMKQSPVETAKSQTCDLDESAESSR